MSEDFFGFETGLPEGAEFLENDLMEASGDHREIDLVNDETFGDYEQEWHFDDHDAVLEQEEEEEDVPVEYMEKSISQLVVDDDEIVDPAIVDARTKPKFIPHREAQNIDELFGPASPPSLLDADELVSPDHHNIWRPNRNSPASSHPLLIQHPPLEQQPFHDPSIVTAGKAITAGFPDSLMKAPYNRAPGSLTRHYTLDEVERRILNASPSSGLNNGRSSPGQSTLINRSFPVHIRHPMPPGMGPVSPGPVSMMKHPSQAPVGTPARNQMGFPGQRAPQRMTFRGPPPGLNTGQLPPRMGPGPMGQGDGPWPHGTGYQMHTPRGQRPMMRGPYTDPGPRHRPPFTRPMGVDMRQHDLSMREHRDGQLMRDGQFSDRRDHHTYVRVANASREMARDSPRGGARDGVRDDDFLGPDSLMTQREKDWVIKIQMIQLHTDNPYIDDYYFMQYKMKQLAAERKKQKVGVQSGQGDDTPRLLLPQLTHIETRNYTPAQFEGVLGRLTASSVHNPRPVIDCKINVSHTDEGNLKGTKYKEVLVYIEKLYDILLDVDDLEKRMLASAEDTHPKLLAERRHKLDGFYLSLDCEGTASSPKFTSLMCIRKGKMLISRVLPLLTKEQQLNVVDHILKQLPILIKKDVADELLPSMFDSVALVIQSASQEKLVDFSQSLLSAAVPTSQTNPLLTAIQNKFGLSVICAMLQRCESIYVDDPLEVENNLREKWSHFLCELAERLTQANNRSLPLPKPLAKFDNLDEHMERTLDKKTLLSVEEVLKSWS